jgi:AcrR family transcriptional regulator
MTEVRRRERKKAEVRSAIISSAMGLFGNQGLGATTIEQIATAADVGKGTIYNYFQTKEEIIVAFLADIERQVQEKLLEFDAFAGDVDDVLSEFILFQMRIKEPHHQFVRVFLGQIFGRREHLFPYLVEMQKWIDPPLELLFRSLRERGMIREDIEPQDILLAFKTAQMGLTSLWAMEGPPFGETARMVRLQMKLFSEGLKAGEAYEV